MDPEKVNYHYCDDLPTGPLPPGTRVLVTGASGYVARRLVPELIARGYFVRCMLRSRGFPPLLEHPNLEFVYADARKPEELPSALEGIHTAYYLIHSMQIEKEDFSKVDQAVARNFLNAADQAGLKKIIYLGGLGETNENLSPHLKSRLEVGVILSKARCPVIRLRAAIIVGTGSASYDLVKSLVMNHRWIPFLPEFNSKCQPIAIRDVIKYMVGAMEREDLKTGKYPIGGPDIMTYKELIKRFALANHRRVRFFDVSWVPMPVNWMCRILAVWLHFFIPVPVNVTSLLLGSLKVDVVCPDNRIRDLIPFAPLDFETALSWAKEKEKNQMVFSRWSDLPPQNMSDMLPIAKYESADFIIEEHSRSMPVPPEKMFEIVCSIGGDRGWYHANLLWKIRGWIDRLMGGVGLQRGRRDPNKLRAGDSVDFWRVEHLEAPKELLLRGELMSPGLSWLQFELNPEEENKTLLTLRAHFIPYPIWGHLYWGVLSKFHTYIFKGTLEKLHREAMSLTS